MKKKTWIILGIVIVAIILVFGAVKLFPFGYTVTSVVSFMAGATICKYVMSLKQ